MTRRSLAAIFFAGGVVFAQTPHQVQEVLALCRDYNPKTTECINVDERVTTVNAELKRLGITCIYGIEAKEKGTVFCLQPKRKGERTTK